MKKTILGAVLATMVFTVSITSAFAGQWKKDNGAWYYYHSDGRMATNEWAGNYYLGSDGAMLSNTTTPDGYKVDANGAWINENFVPEYKSLINTYGSSKFKLSSATFKKEDLIDHGTYYEIKNQDLLYSPSGEFATDEGDITIPYHGSIYFKKNVPVTEYDGVHVKTVTEALDNPADNAYISYSGEYIWCLDNADSDGFFTFIYEGGIG